MKKLKGTLSAILLLVMLVSLFTGCGGTNGDGKTTGTGDAATSAPDLPTIPETLRFDNYEFTIIVNGNYIYDDFKVDETTADQVNTARLKWLSAAQERFGITIGTEEYLKFGSSGGGGTGYTKIVEANRAGETYYDAGSIGTYDVAVLAHSGYLGDLNAMPYVNLDNSYWDQKANTDLGIKGKMYYTTGDIAIIDNITTHCILFNKDLISSIGGMEDPYTLVKEGKWTVDKMAEQVKLGKDDLDGNGTFDKNDRYGLLTWNDAMLAILAAAGEKIAKIDDEGAIELSLYNERTVTLYEKFTGMCFDSESVFNYQFYNSTSSTWDPTRIAMFDGDQAVYYTTLFTTIPKHRDSQTDFGIIPYPKLDETQSNYGHMVSAFHCQFVCVPAMVENEECSGAVLEWLAYTGKQTMTPAYYDKTLIGTQVRDDESVEMLDIIFASRVFDVGIYYKVGGYKDTLAKDIYGNRSLTLASIYETSRSKAETTIDEINTYFGD